MHPSLLQNISQPRDLKRLSSAQIQQLCGEIRQFLLDSVSKTGGHLASNLGAVELTVALHRVFETPQDAFVFDVGHQCYTHKLLTGRYKRFGTLRQLDGLSGFPNPNESAHDAFIAGHGNTALSVAIGIAWAKKLKGEPGHVVAIIGDGAFTGGMVYEGMNNIGKPSKALFRTAKKQFAGPCTIPRCSRIWGFTILDSSTATTSRNWNAFSRLSVLSPGRHCSMS